MEDLIDAFPEIFIPDTPEADPDSYPSLQDLVDHLEETNQQAKDLWKRDKDGKLLKEPTGKTLVRQYGTEYEVEYKELKIKIRNDIEVIAYEVVKVKDLATNQYFTEIPDRFKSNCTGYAFVKGDMWLFDTNVVFVVHVHPPNASAAPSSTDIYGLNDHGADFAGSIILHGNDMYLMSITDEAAYDKFNLKSNQRVIMTKTHQVGGKRNQV